MLEITVLYCNITSADSCQQALQKYKSCYNVTEEINETMFCSRLDYIFSHPQTTKITPVMHKRFPAVRRSAV